MRGTAGEGNPELHRLEAGEACRLVRDRHVSAAELTAAVIARLEETEPLFGCYTGLCLEQAMDDARDVDHTLARGEDAGPLAGVPMAVKDNICLAATPTTCGSRHLESYRPGESATVVRRLRRAGAVLLGKTNLDEFAMGSSTEYSAFGPTRNPWDAACVPGGSSGGSAAAVAAGSALGALGSDTGGSVRQPAAFCGMVGLRPTYGTVSRYGLVSFVSSLDQVGPIARSVADCALITGVIQGRDSLDSTSMDPPPTTGLETGPGIGGMRFGLLRPEEEQDLHPEVDRLTGEAMALLRTMGATVTELALPHQHYGLPAYAFIAAAEAGSNLGRYDGVRFGQRLGEDLGLEDMYYETRSRGFGPEVKRRILLGAWALQAGFLGERYLQAQKVRTLILDDYRRAFRSVDVVCCPTATTPAFRLGERTENPLEMYQSDVNTVSSSLAGLPSITVPCGLAGGRLPVGLQFTGPAFGEPVLFRATAAYEEASGYRNLRAP